MAKDQQGLTLAGSPESAAAFDRAIADYYGLTGDPVGVLKQALARDPGFRARRRRDRRALHDRRFSRRPSGGGQRAPRGRSGDSAAPRSASGAISPPPRPGREGKTSRGDPRLGDDPGRSSDRRARLAPGAGRLLLSRPVARHPRLRRAGPAGLGSRQSAHELRPRPLRLRARGDGRPQARRGCRPRGAGAQSARRLGDACARPCDGDREPPGGGRRLSQVDARGLERQRISWPATTAGISRSF